MSVGYDIRSLLETAGIHADVNNINSALASTISVMETGGYPPTRCNSSNTPAPVTERLTVQIIVRDPQKPAANKTITQIIAALDDTTNCVVNDTHYVSLMISIPPVFLGRVQTGQGETNEYSINFEAIMWKTYK
ncbi:MAG: hypothetical protein E7Z72_00620 [Methanocorpusculum parvum]|nr:hypothetical protein [Methanocorpusculum parvum]